MKALLAIAATWLLLSAATTVILGAVLGRTRHADPDVDDTAAELCSDNPCLDPAHWRHPSGCGSEAAFGAPCELPGGHDGLHRHGGTEWGRW